MLLTEVIRTRRSIRKFSPCEIQPQIIEEIIEAGSLAPSAKNRQPWHFYVICKEETKNEFIQAFQQGIQELLAKYELQKIRRLDIERAQISVNSMRKAAAVILVTCQKKYKEIYKDEVNWYLHALDIEAADILSIGAAIENMLLKAADLGYGSLWVCDIFYGYPRIAEFLQTDHAILSAVCIGKSGECPKERSRLPLESIISYL